MAAALALARGADLGAALALALGEDLGVVLAFGVDFGGALALALGEDLDVVLAFAFFAFALGAALAFLLEAVFTFADDFFVAIPSLRN